MTNPRLPKTGSLSQRSFLGELVKTDSDSISLSISSTAPYLRQFGYEVLDHSPESVDLTRLLNGASVRNDHDGPQIGVVTGAWLDGDNKLRASIKFSKGQLGSEIEQDVKDGIRRNVSIGYQVLQWDNPKERSMINGQPVFTATRWAPFHVAIVPDPADHTVGFARALTSVQIAVLQELLDRSATDTEEVTEEPAVEAPTEVETAAVESVEVAEEEAATNAVEEKAMESTTQELLTDSTRNMAEEVTEAESTPNKEPTGPTFSQETRHMEDNVQEVTNPNIVLTEKELKQYSVSRAIVASANGKRSGFEFEVSDTIARSLNQETNGFFMPTSIRAYATNDSTTGGAITFTQPGGDVIDFLRNRAVVAQAGAQVLSLTEKIAFPKWAGDIAATWVAEDGPGASLTSASLAQVTLSPHTLIAGPTPYTLATKTIGSYDIDNLITSNMYSSIAIAFDKAAIQGDGINAPLGILNTPGLASGSAAAFASGSALNFAGPVDLWNKVASANADSDRMCYVTVPAVSAQAMTTLRASGVASPFIMTDDKKIAGYEVFNSKNVPAYSGGGQYLIFGDWSSMYLASFGAINIVVDPLTLAGAAKYVITGQMLGDVQLKHIESFAILKGINA